MSEDEEQEMVDDMVDFWHSEGTGFGKKLLLDDAAREVIAKWREAGYLK